MRILVVVNARLPTESAHGHQTARMAAAFAALGHRVDVWHPRRAQADPQVAQAGVHRYYGVAPTFGTRAIPNVDVVRLERVLGPSLFRVAFGAHALAWALGAAVAARRAAPDLLFTREMGVAYWATRLGLPTAWEVHRAPGRAGRRLVRALAASGALRAVLPLTSALRDDLVAIGVPPERLTVLPSAVDAERFAALPDRDACRAALGLPAGRPLVGFVGRFEAMGAGRGLDILVEAVARLIADGVDVDLACVGGPMSAVPPLRRLAASRGMDDDRLRFVDRLPPDEAAYWVRALDVAVVPSPPSAHYARASSPLKLFEYMAAGTPVVASDLPAIRDVVIHGRDAWLVPPDDPAALADGIAALLADPALAARLAASAARAVRDHTWEARAARVLAAAGHGTMAPTAGGRPDGLGTR